MILADTSVWIDHLRRHNSKLEGLLNAGDVVSHPFVIGELALGGHRASMIFLMQNLARATRAADDEVLRFITDCKLYGRGIGYVDAHLLASARLTPGTRLWTLDQKLHAVALELRVAF